MKKIETHKCHGGDLEIWEHKSAILKCTMRFSIFLPPQVSDGKIPLITFLSGLTCTHENFTTKSGAYQKAAELGIAIVAPDTSPRGDDVPDDDAYDFGKGAGFYVNATQGPWANHYQMESYIVEELQAILPECFNVDTNNQSIMGHSMGGHGALTLYLKYPTLYKSVSAFSPIVAPSQVPWGQKAFAGYLGSNKEEWLKHDACALMLCARKDEILIDQGLDDDFLKDQLRPEIFQDYCDAVGQKLILRQHKGYDHSYYFIQSFIDDHLVHHDQYLT